MTQTYRGYSAAQIAAHIDHSVLKPESLIADVRLACQQAIEWRTASVCIRPMDVKLAVSLLDGSGIPVCTVIGFPHGTTTTAAKVAETVEAVVNGCLEVDMVLNVSALIEGNLSAVESDIRAVVAAAKQANPQALVKVIFETCLLNDQQIIEACRLSEAAGANFVKTSTGFGKAGATLEHIRLMRHQVGDRLQVKASGGIRTLDQVIDLIEAGADRCGASATADILKPFTSKYPLD